MAVKAELKISGQIGRYSLCYVGRFGAYSARYNAALENLLQNLNSRNFIIVLKIISRHFVQRIICID